MKKKVIISISIGIFCTVLYVLLRSLLLKNYDNYPFVNGWLTFLTIMVGMIYLLAISFWLRNDISAKFKSSNVNSFGYFPDEPSSFSRKLNSVKFIKYLQGNETIDDISTFSTMFTIIPLLIYMAATCSFPELSEHYTLLRPIAIVLIFLSAILYLTQAIVRSNVPKKAKYSLILVFIWTFLGIINLLS